MSSMNLGAFDSLGFEEVISDVEFGKMIVPAANMMMSYEVYRSR